MYNTNTNTILNQCGTSEDIIINIRLSVMKNALYENLRSFCVHMIHNGALLNH